MDQILCGWAFLDGFSCLNRQITRTRPRISNHRLWILIKCQLVIKTVKYRLILRKSRLCSFEMVLNPRVVIVSWLCTHKPMWIPLTSKSQSRRLGVLLRSVVEGLDQRDHIRDFYFWIDISNVVNWFAGQEAFCCHLIIWMIHDIVSPDIFLVWANYSDFIFRVWLRYLASKSILPIQKFWRIALHLVVDLFSLDGRHSEVFGCREVVGNVWLGWNGPLIFLFRWLRSGPKSLIKYICRWIRL